MTPTEIEELDILMSLLMTGAATEIRVLDTGTLTGRLLNLEYIADIIAHESHIDNSTNLFVCSIKATLTDLGRAYLREHYPKRVALLDKENA